MDLGDFKEQMQNAALMSPDKKNIAMQHIVYENGFEKQHIIIMEELSELTQQVSKQIRYGETDENLLALIEEMADVKICLEMLRYMHDIPVYDLDKAVSVKLRRALRNAEGER